MKLLERYISAYTGTNLFLGVFTTEKLAKENKNRYIEEVENNDSFKHQTHHSVELEKDIKIVDIKVDGNWDGVQKEFYLISAFSEAFGQITIDFKIMTFSKERADELVKMMEEKDEMFVTEYEIEKYILNELYL